MAVENLLSTAATLKTQGRLVERNAAGAPLKIYQQTIEMSAAATNASTYDFFDIPSDLKIWAIQWRSDDLATTGSPTIDVGLFHADLASGGDDNALLDGLDVATGALSTITYDPIGVPGQEAWDYVASQTTDPNQMLTVRATLQDAACDSGGTMTLTIIGS